VSKMLGLTRTRKWPEGAASTLGARARTARLTRTGYKTLICAIEIHILINANITVWRHKTVMAQCLTDLTKKERKASHTVRITIRPS
jgi:hypothetical protein